MGVLVKLELVVGSTSLDISDIQNFMWAGHAGFGMAALHRLLIRGPQQMGDTDIGYLLDPRIIQLTARLMATDIETLYTRQDQLLRMLNPSNTPIGLRFTRLVSGIVRQLDVFAVGGLDFPTTGRGGYTMLEQVTLRANDPTWYDPTPGSLGFSAGGGAAAFAVPLAVPHAVGASTVNQSQPISYPGTADSFPWMTLTGPITSPVITVSDGTTSQKLDFTGVTVAGGDVRVIDTRYPTKSVVDINGANKNGDLTTDSNLATLDINKCVAGQAVHPSTVTLVGSGINAVTRLDFNFYNRYIGV